MISLLFVLAGGLWFMVCMIIGLNTNKKFIGFDATQNYIDSLDNRLNQVNWNLAGIFGMIMWVVIGLVIK